MHDYNKLINSKEFKNWKNKNKNAYLSSCVLMDGSRAKEIWAFDFYLPNKNRITTFSIGEDIQIIEDQKIFGQKTKKLNKIDVEEIKFDLNDVNKFINKEYKVKLMKKIIVLQNLNRLLWNISLLGVDFNLVNIKLDAKTGKILEKSVVSMLQFKTG